MNDQDKAKTQKPLSETPTKPGKLPANQLSDEEIGKVSGGDIVVTKQTDSSSPKL